jgi:membrane glycosyltransferase
MVDPDGQSRNGDRAGLLAGLVLALSLSATVLFYRVVRPCGLTITEGVALVLFVPLFGTLIFNFLTTGAGFIRGIWSIRRTPAVSLTIRAVARQDGAWKTALVMVIRHEDVGRV